MSIPKNITREHINKAIGIIKAADIPSERLSYTYFLEVNGEELPPKYVISIANKYANGAELDSEEFNAVEAKHFLINLGYTINTKNEQMELPRIFIAPRSGEQSAGNFAKTIEGGYKKKDLLRFLSKEDQEELKDFDTLMIWGNKPSLKSRWEKMRKDDWVLFYQNGTITFAGKLLYKTHNKLLADNLWGPEKKKGEEPVSWEYVFFLKDLNKTEKPYKEMAEMAGYNGSVVQGFLPYKEAGVKRIIDTYGSIESYLLGHSSKQITKDMSIQNSYKRELLSIKTKPFLLMAGISGTGKSRLVRTLAYQTCSKKELQADSKKPGNFELIPVRPNWHDSSELIGYVSRINGEKYIVTPFLRFIAKAWKYPDIPFFLCLDEMNLAPVEQYFAEYLSIIETRQIKDNHIMSDYIISKADFENQELYKSLLRDLSIVNDERFNEGIRIPENLIVIGTVNMDETTHSFSRKVLDRAMTFEMNEVDLNGGLNEGTIDWAYPQEFISAKALISEHTEGREVANKYPESKQVISFLENINKELEGTPFKIAYRVRDEFLIYCYYASKEKSDRNWLNTALDEMTCMKILSRIEGDEAKTGNVLRRLQSHFNQDFKRTTAKLKEMEERLQRSSYTSFWS